MDKETLAELMRNGVETLRAAFYASCLRERSEGSRNIHKYILTYLGIGRKNPNFEQSERI